MSTVVFPSRLDGLRIGALRDEIHNHLPMSPRAAALCIGAIIPVGAKLWVVPAKPSP
jgi:hypothetical protein